MKYSALITLLIVALLVTGCGGKDDTKKTNNTTTDGVNTANTGNQLQPRIRNAPQTDDPYTFEAPISAGSFVRENMHGQVTAAQAGGLEAVYDQGDQEVVLTIYHFDTSHDAMTTARFILESDTITHYIGEPYLSDRAVYGIGQDRHGGYIAVWSYEEWTYMAHTVSGEAALNSFLESFPY